MPAASLPGPARCSSPILIHSRKKTEKTAASAPARARHDGVRFRERIRALLHPQEPANSRAGLRRSGSGQVANALPRSPKQTF